MLREDEDFEQVFKTLLKENGYTQASLAKWLHVTPGAVTRWIKRLNRIPYETLKTISDLWKLDREKKAKLFRTAGYPLPSEYSDILPRPSSTVEALSPDYIHRPQEFETLKKSLLGKKPEQLTAITSALKGAGGYGKTTLAQALCHDPDIQAAFSDGIEWVTLGESLKPGELVQKVKALVYRLTQTTPPVESLEVAIAELRVALEDRYILLVVDDVWFTSDLKPFLQGGPRCVRLITTRNEGVLPPGVPCVQVDAMRQEEAVLLLYKDSGSNAEFKLYEQALYNLAQRLKEWPLLIALANGILRNRVQKHNQPISVALAYLEHELDKHGLVAFDPYQPHERREAVARTLEISFALLREDDFARYLRLAIFPEDAEIPFEKIWYLWKTGNNLDEEDVETICLRLYDLSLLRSIDLTQRHIKLHDVVRAYLHTKMQQTLSLFQQEFLQTHNLTRWADLPLSDAYLWKYLISHLIQANQPDLLLETITDFRYLAKKIYVQHSAYAAEADIEYAMSNLTDKTYLTNLRELLANFGDLFYLCETLEEVECLLLIRISQLHDFSTQYRRFRQEMSHPYLLPWHPLPIRKGSHPIRTLRSHRLPVTYCAISPDGSWLVSASQDTTLNVWNMMTGALRFTLQGHTASVTSCAISPSGNRIVSTSEDGTIRIWNAYSGNELLAFSGHQGAVLGCAVSPDGSWLATTSEDMTIKIWDIHKIYEQPTHQGYKALLKRTLRGHNGPVKSCAISSDGSWLVSASQDQTLRFWNVRTGQQLLPYLEQTDAIYACAISTDGTWLVSTDEIGLKVWDVPNRTERFTTYGHSGVITGCAISPDETWMLSASMDGSMKGWLTSQALDIFIFQGHGDSVNHCAINAHGDRVVSASDDHTLEVWAVPALTGERMSGDEEYSFGIHGCAIDSSGDWAVSVRLSGELKRWNLHQIDTQNVLNPSADAFAKCVISPNGRWIATAFGRQSLILTLWDALTGTEVISFQGHTKTITSCAISPDNTWVVTASEDQTLKIWDISTGQQKFTLTGHAEAVNSCVISANGKWIVSASSDQTLKIWNAQTGTLQQTLQGHQDKVRDCAITPDGDTVLSGSDDGTLRLWKISAPEKTHNLFKYEHRVERCIISPDGKLSLSLSGTQMKVWSLSTEHCLTTFYSHQPLFDCAFHPDGYHLIVAAEDGLYFFSFSS